MRNGHSHWLHSSRRQVRLAVLSRFLEMGRSPVYRVHQCSHIRDSESFRRLSRPVRSVHTTLRCQYTRRCIAATCLHHYLCHFLVGDQDQTEQNMDVPIEEMYPQLPCCLLHQLYLHYKNTRQCPQLRRSP